MFDRAVANIVRLRSSRYGVAKGMDSPISDSRCQRSDAFKDRTTACPLQRDRNVSANSYDGCKSCNPVSGATPVA